MYPSLNFPQAQSFEPNPGETVEIHGYASCSRGITELIMSVDIPEPKSGEAIDCHEYASFYGLS